MTAVGLSTVCAAIATELGVLFADPAVPSRKGIYEYLLGGGTERQLLAVRLFDDKTKRQAYARQTTAAKANNVSNARRVATGTNTNQTRIYTPDEMEADHATAWSHGGPAALANCEMLCVPHNRAKGHG